MRRRWTKTSCHQLAHQRLLVLVLVREEDAIPSVVAQCGHVAIHSLSWCPSVHPSVCYGFTRGRRPLPCGGCLLIQSRADPLFSESECARFKPSLRRNLLYNTKPMQERCVGAIKFFSSVDGRLWLFLTIVQIWRAELSFFSKHSTVVDPLQIYSITLQNNEQYKIWKTMKCQKYCTCTITKSNQCFI